MSNHPPTARSEGPEITSEALKAWAENAAADCQRTLNSFQMTGQPDAYMATQRMIADAIAHYRAVVQMTEDHANLRQAYGAAVQRLHALGETSVPLLAVAEGHGVTEEMIDRAAVAIYDHDRVSDMARTWDQTNETTRDYYRSVGRRILTFALGGPPDPVRRAEAVGGDGR